MPEINPQELKVAENRRRFTEIYRSTVTREGADRLFAYLESTDFFSAPASTRYHGNYEGGLCQHSLNVYDCLCDILARPRMQEVYGIRYSDESIAIAALLHDLCKVNFYKTSFRNAKNEQGKLYSRIAELEEQKNAIKVEHSEVSAAEPGMKICPVCGAESDSKFCPKCGAPMD